MLKNHRACGGPRRASRRLLRTLLPLIGLIVGGACTTDNSPVTSISPPGGGPPQFSFYNAQHDLLQNVAAFCFNLQWNTCLRPEYTDDQALMGENKQTYGPPAFIAPAENLDSFTGDNSFQAAPVLVAYVHVLLDAAPLPSTYTDLKLNYGDNCVYLGHLNGSFKSFVVPAQNATCAPTLPNPLPTPLNVQAIASAAFPGHGNIPPVARFHEGQKGQSAGVPFLGMKCGDKWCLVLADGQGQPVSEWKPPHDGVHNNRRSWAVYGWNDSQHLAIRKQGGGLDRSSMRVSVVAVPNLGNITEAQYTQDFQHVATVYWSGSPSDKYRDNWHYKKGHNEVYLKRVTDQDWRGEIRHVRQMPWGDWVTSITPVPVVRRDHGVPLPGTARFLWTATDEDLWIACEEGCCRVAGQ